MDVSRCITGITPIVLCGGRSRRFGRDKLREPLADGSWLIDRPIAALRAVFGARVALAGECDAALAARGDAVLRDRYPGVGPAGGILSALESVGDVLVLAGDLPRITDEAVRALALAAAINPGAWAVLAATPNIEPCIGVYRVGAVDSLRSVCERSGPLWSAVPEERRVLAPIDPVSAGNANTPDELGQLLERPSPSARPARPVNNGP